MVHLLREATIPNPLPAAVLIPAGERLNQSHQSSNHPKTMQTNKRKHLRQTILTQHPPEIYKELLQMCGSKSNKKESNTLRVVTLNSNGFSDENEYTLMTESMQEHQSDITAYQEVNLDLNRQDLHQKLIQSTKHLDRNLTYSYFTYPTQVKEKDKAYKLGSTLLQVTGKLTSRLSKQLKKKHNWDTGWGRDPIGRWCWITLEGKLNKKLTIINAYRVGKKSLATARTTTIWFQEYEEYMKQGKKNINPRKFMTDDLADFVIYLREKGNSIILLIDVNESYWHDKSDLFEFCCVT